MFRGAWQRLLRIAIFAAVIFFLLSLMGSQLFSNTLRQKCALNSSAVESYKSGEPLKEESFLINPKGAVYYLPCGNSSVWVFMLCSLFPLHYFWCFRFGFAYLKKERNMPGRLRLRRCGRKPAGWARGIWFVAPLCLYAPQRSLPGLCRICLRGGEA